MTMTGTTREVKAGRVKAEFCMVMGFTLLCANGGLAFKDSGLGLQA